MQPLTRSESHCLGSRRRRGRQRPVGATSHKVGEPLPGVEKTERTTKAGGGNLSQGQRTTARGREDRVDDIGRREQPLTRSESPCPGSRRRRGRHRLAGGNLLQDRRSTARCRENGEDDIGRRVQTTRLRGMPKAVKTEETGASSSIGGRKVIRQDLV